MAGKDPIKKIRKGIFEPDTCHALTGYDCDYIPSSPEDFEKHLDSKHGGR